MEIISILRDKVLVEIIEPETKTASGIYIPTDASSKTLKGTVLMVGPKVQFVKPGDTVKYYDHCGSIMEYQGKNCIFLKEETDIEVIL
jgi:chaperonin GroES